MTPGFPTPRYLARRIGVSLLAMAGLTIVAFALPRMIRGDTATVLLGLRATQADRAALHERYALDEPWPRQFATWVGLLARGDLGQTRTGRPVTTALRQAMPVTLLLTAGALAVGIFAGIPMGLLAARRPGGWVDHACSTVSLLGLSVPGFWLGVLLILLFALQLGWFPAGGGVAFAQAPLSRLSVLALPVMALGAAVAAVIMRMTRSATIEVMQQDYIRTARAKGAGEGRIAFRHALRNAAVPIVTILGMQVGYLLGGAVVIEELFSLPGLGKLMLHAVLNRDYPLIQGVILLAGAVFISVNLLVDLSYHWLDPRISGDGVE